ncbi:MAG: hypothetical protein IPO92_05135 [Saprospiraceae bacterium]|nr:hypothetical protein [Saprospiraceae bacterium]
MKIFPCILILTMFIISSCDWKQNKKSIKSLDLMKYGIPYAINAPADAVVTKLGSGQLIDILIKNKDGYDVQAFMSLAYTNDLNKLKQNKKEEIISNPYFVKIIEEFDEGFLFEKKTSEGVKSYDFNIIKIVGDNEINFQCGNSKEFSERDVKSMIKTIVDL